jgi:hypothetical protein
MKAVSKLLAVSKVRVSKVQVLLYNKKLQANLYIGIPHYRGFHILYSITQVFYLTFIGQIVFYLL